MLGERLKNIRKLKKMTSEQFAQIVNIPSRTLYGYERGERNPPYELLVLYSEKFNVNLHWLLTGKGEPFITDQSSQLDDNVLKIKVKKGQKLLIEYED